MRNTKEEMHESYGMATFSRIKSSEPKNLFGSSIKHVNMIALKIFTAIKKRDLHMDWYHADKQLIKIEMSQTQFAELISSMNQGDGFPVTLKYYNGKKIEECPESHTKEDFSDEFASSLKLIAEKFTDLQKFADTLSYKVSIPKKDRKELIHKINMLKQDIESNLPFIEESFKKSMDSIVTSAKGEIDAALTHHIYALGLKEFSKEIEKKIFTKLLD